MTDIDGEPGPGGTATGEAEETAATNGTGASTGPAAEDLEARYTRLAADFENLRKRTAREQMERSRYASEDAARALLPVLDNLRRALESAPSETPPALLEGLRFTVRQFEDALASVGVKPIEAAGAVFDPKFHEAVLGEDSPDVDVDTVADELQRGYLLHDRVLRPTMVKVVHPLPGRSPGDGFVEA